MAAVQESIELADLSLEQLMDVRIASVVGASKYEQKVTRAPASVTVLDRPTIQRFGSRTLAELLRSVRGVYISDDRNYSYLGMRGFLRPGDYNTRTLMLLDGHRVNEAIFDSFYIDQNAMLDLDLIERVEVVRGPSSSVYGSNAFFGVINVVPRRGADINGTELAAGAGALRTHQARATFGRGFGESGDVLISASFSERGGNRQLYFPEFDPRISDDPRADNDGIAEDFDGEKAGQVYATLSYGDVKLTVFGSTREREVPTASFDTAFNARAETVQDDRGFIDLRFDREILDDTRWSIRSYLDGYSYRGAYPYLTEDESTEPALFMNLDDAYALWAGLETHVLREFSGGHTLLVGGEYRNNLRQDMFNYDVTDPRTYYVDVRGRSSTHALFAEAELAFTSQLSLVAGLRYDGESEGEDAIHPRLAAIFSPWTGGTAKLLYGSAFRTPNAYERDYLEHDGPLRDERIRTYEAVFEQYWQEDYRAALSAYTYEVTDLISIGGDDSAYQKASNIGRTSARGIEAEFEAHLSTHTIFRTSFALQRSKDRERGEELTNSPQRLFKAQVLVPLHRFLTAGLEVQYSSGARTIGGGEAPAFWLTNLTLFHADLHPRLTVSGSIYNLFDEDYTYPGSTDHLQSTLLQDGRTYRLKVEYRF